MKLLLLLTLGFAVLAYARIRDSSPDIVPIPGGLQGSGRTTRYWDCCVPACSYPLNMSVVSHGVVYCDADGTSRIDNYTKQSECAQAGGGAFTCNEDQPWIVNATLAYGFTAASFGGGIETNDCCKCVLMAFQGALEGKFYLAQITNTGSDLTENHFDIQIPGGGVGIFNGCSAQWNAPDGGWGERYGGVTTEEECDELPTVLREGCKFRWEFLEGVANPNVTFTQVRCPTELTTISGCVNVNDPA